MSRRVYPLSHQSLFSFILRQLHSVFLCRVGPGGRWAARAVPEGGAAGAPRGQAAQEGALHVRRHRRPPHHVPRAEDRLHEGESLQSLSNFSLLK